MSIWLKKSINTSVYGGKVDILGVKLDILVVKITI